jgi:ribulose-phosphate 3-epimerase
MLSVSILSADFGTLKQELNMINTSDADLIHVDIMDGVFVPNISFGEIILETVIKHSLKPVDIHLMINNPINYLHKIINFNINSISVHYECTKNLYNVISLIKHNNIKPGLVINPYTPVNILDDIIHDIDVVTIMGVNPGLGGQKLIPYTYSKLGNIVKLIQCKGLKTLIQIDGGVDEINAISLLKSGANILVSGSCIFNDANPHSVISNIKNLNLKN